MAQPLMASGPPDAAHGAPAALGARLAVFDTPGAEAYALPGRDDAYALVHRHQVPVRANVVDALPRMRRTSLLNLLEQRIVTLHGGMRLVSIIERPQGPCLGEVAATRGLPDRVIRQDILPPLAAALRALHEVGVAHRGINPRRLFYGGDDLGKVRLGECFSAPAGMLQPAVFEPAERMLAHEAGRGEGTAADDYYALGVTVLALIKGQDLAQGRSAEQLAAAKIAHGSFWALSGGTDHIGGFGALLRGLLHDDPRERWGAEQLSDWLGGAARNATPPANPWLFARPVTFGGVSHADRRTLVQAMAADPAETTAFLKRLDLPHWLGLHLPEAPNTVEFCRLLTTGQGGRRGDIAATGPDYVTARFCALLDPMGPIRFRGLTVMPDGLGPVLAYAQAKDAELRETMLALVTSPQLSIIGDIAAMAPEGARRIHFAHDLTALGKLIHVRSQADSAERALYGLNPGLVCQSPLFTGRWVASPSALVQSVNQMAQGGGHLDLSEPHITAFLAASSPAAADEFRRQPAVQRDGQALSAAMLTIFGAIQQTEGLDAMPALTSYFGKRLMPAVQKLRSAATRARAEKRLKAVMAKGDLSLMANIFDIAALTQKDRAGFNAAHAKVAMIGRQLHVLETKISPRDPLPVLHGARGGAFLATAVLGVSVALRLMS